MILTEENGVITVTRYEDLHVHRPDWDLLKAHDTEPANMFHVPCCGCMETGTVTINEVGGTIEAITWSR